MRWLAAGAICALLAGAAAAASPPELARAHVLLRAGKAEEAYRLLAPLEKRLAGEPDFDLALAMAATDSGRPNLATFTLERLVVAQPENATARLELARAYFALRDHERAERELQFILRADPPPSVRALVERYRERMGELPSRGWGSGRWSGYAEAGAGRDSNPNAAISQASVFIPSLGSDLALAPTQARDADNFALLGGALEYSRPLSARWTLLAGGEVEGRAYADVDTADSLALDLYAGLRQTGAGDAGVQYTARHAELEFDHAGYRRVQSIGADWRRALGERTRLTLSGHGYRIRYLAETARSSSSNMAVAGAQVARLLEPSSGTAVLAGAFIGRDDAVDARDDGDRNLYGASGGLQRRLHPRLDAYATVAVSRSQYRQTNADFGVARADRQTDLAFGLSWRLQDGWSLRPQIARTRNRSNIALNDYSRTEASLILRRSWD